MFRFITILMCFGFLAACDKSGSDTGNTKSGNSAAIIDDMPEEPVLGHFPTKLAFKWYRGKLVDGDLVTLVPEGVHVTSQGAGPEIAYDASFQLTEGLKYEVQLDYEIFQDASAVTPDITAWGYDAEGKILDKPFKVKLFKNVDQQGTLVANFHASGSKNLKPKSVPLPENFKKVVFTTNPARGVNGTSALIKRFEVTVEK